MQPETLSQHWRSAVKAPVTVRFDVAYGVNLIIRINYTASNGTVNMSDGLEGMWEGTLMAS